MKHQVYDHVYNQKEMQFKKGKVWMIFHFGGLCGCACMSMQKDMLINRLVIVIKDN